MNNHQEALNTLVRYAHESPNVKWSLIHEENIIQELVDKETPMKPVNQYPIDFGLGNYGECKRCNNGVTYQQNRCDDCGQRIDWNE